MRLALVAASLGALALAGMSGTAPAFAAESAQSKSCWSKADQQRLKGAEREAFHTACLKGDLTPPGPSPKPKTVGAAAITAPSGADKTVRAKQCAAEGAKRGLKDAAYEAFHKGCLASAAPTTAVGSMTRPTTPTPAKPKIDALTSGARP